MSKKPKNKTNANTPLAIERGNHHPSFAVDTWLLRSSLTTSGIVTDIEVVGSPVVESGGGGTTPVAQKVQDFVDVLNAKGPTTARRSSDRVYNLNQLHDAVIRKFDAAYEDPTTRPLVLSVDLNDPLELLHRIDRDDPREWIRVRGTEAFGGNIYEVFLPDGTSQSIAIQYVSSES